MAKQSHSGVKLRTEGPRDGVFKVALAGRLDSSTTGGVWRQATAAVSGAKAPSVVVDARSIDYCDGAGIALLVQLRQLQSQAGGTLQIDGLRPEFANLINDAAPNLGGEVGGEISQGGLAVEIGEATVELWRDIQVLVSFIGELVMEKLHDLDKIAYVRFASVYRQFEDVKDFVDEVRSMPRTSA